ncbi:MAG TPA: diaminopimelate epimerase [Nocardioides sp.]|nr:diaminopimelate epimerase [Nocardioides sp.]
MSYPFRKGHGTENDFVLLPDHDGSIHGDLSGDRFGDRVRALCDRRAGLGADGVLRVIGERGRWDPTESELRGRSETEASLLARWPDIEPDPEPPEWFMDYRNADGGIAEMCGNGIRVFALHLYDEGLVPPDEPVRIATRAGVKTVTREGDLFCADLGVATILGETKVSVGERSWPAVHVDLGNPHAVVTVDDLAEIGSLREEPVYDVDLYPDGVNVEFVVRRGPGHVAMRVHERGSGETRSCGTGACAAAVATATEGPGRWRVDVPGGRLEVSRDELGRVSLIGPAVIVAQGTTSL